MRVRGPLPISTIQYGPDSSITCPLGATLIPVGSTTASRQALINAAPTGASFCIQSGLHGASGNNTPKSGQTFTGQYGAIIDGTGWVSSNPDDGAFQALNVDVDNVVIKNLIIRNMPQKGVKSWHDFSSGWTVDHCEIFNCLYGIELSPSNIITHNYIHHNISLTSPDDPNPNLRGGGIIGEFADNVLMDTNEISFNGSETKWLEASGIICRNNYVHHNHENGLWYDTCSNVLVENNRCEDNTIGAGIFIEACNGTNIIRSNFSNQNHSGIFLSTSNNCDVYGNTLDSNNYNIPLLYNFLVISVDHDLANNSIHGNVIRTPNNYAASLDHVGAGDTTPYISNAKNNTFSNNTYYVINSGGTWWYWEGNKTWAQWQAIPQDTDSTLIVV